MKNPRNTRNVCIMAHVDHGKTTLVDEIIKVTYASETKQSMDKNDLERERGITILAKATCIEYKSEKHNSLYKIHIVDTPGHADFGSEVERILSMIEMAILLVDAAEGIMPQTEFVVKKAVEAQKDIMVIINKIDKLEARIEEVETEIFNYLIAIGYEKIPKFFYGSGRQAYFSSDINIAKNINQHPEKKNLTELLDAFCEECPAPKVEDDQFKFLVTLLDYDPFFKKIYIGKIYAGQVKEGDNIIAIDSNGKKIDSFRVLKLFKFIGANKVPIEEANGGDIIGISGGSEAITVNNTLCTSESTKPLPARPIDPPTMSVEIRCNTSPFAGRDTTNKGCLTFNAIKKRLEEEARTNVGIRLEHSGKSETIQLKFRGELQLGVLLENMRREGFELTVMKPKVLIRDDNKEPVEIVIIDTNQEYVSGIINEMNNRKALIEDITEIGGKQRITLKCPTRFLMGFESIIKSNTCGNAVINRAFSSYEENFGQLTTGQSSGLLLSSATGQVTQYALEGLSVSHFFVAPGDQVYEGQVVGANSRPGDMIINPTKLKALTNFRTQSSEGIKDKQQIEKLTMAEVIDGLNNAFPTIKKTEICLEITPKRLVLRSIAL
jgi:GTP-binding protein